MSMPQPKRYYPDSPLLRSIAHEFVKIYGDLLSLKHLRPEAILFIEDTLTEAKQDKIDKGEAKIFEVKELHPALAERLNADYMVIYFKLNGNKVDPAKLNAFFLEALLKIDPSGGLRQPDVKTFFALAHTLGPNWKAKKYVADVRMGELHKGRAVQSTLDALAMLKEAGSEHAGELLEQANQSQLQDLADGLAKGVGHEVTVSAGGQEATGRPITLAATEKATLHVPADGPPTLEITGPDSTRQIPATSTDDWQPPDPLVRKDNVVPLRQATGTDQGS